MKFRGRLWLPGLYLTLVAGLRNSIFTRIKLCDKQFWSFIAWPFSWSLEYCTHSAKLAL